jgi:hypothetical protein
MRPMVKVRDLPSAALGLRVTALDRNCEPMSEHVLNEFLVPHMLLGRWVDELGDELLNTHA